VTPTPTPIPFESAEPTGGEPAPTGLSNVALVGLLVLAIAALAAVVAWLYDWYQKRSTSV
jgi:hypothetical protein